jgi:hypothetical protein
MPESLGQLLDVLDAPVSPVRVRLVPLPLDGNERYQWRLAAVLLALAACRGRSASVEQLHTLVWVMNDPLNADRFEAAWSRHSGGFALRGYVTGLLDTLRVAQVEGLVEQAANGRQKLSDTGTEFVRAFRADGGSLGRGDDVLLAIAPITSTEMWRRLGESN